MAITSRHDERREHNCIPFLCLPTCSCDTMFTINQKHEFLFALINVLLIMIINDALWNTPSVFAIGQFHGFYPELYTCMMQMNDELSCI